MRASRAYSAFLLVLVFSGCVDDGDGDCSRIAESGDWKREGVVFADPQVANVDVVRTSGGYRMLIHQPGRITSAFSGDGKSFAFEEGTRVEGEMPALVQLGDGSWRLYYRQAMGGAGAIRSATTMDAHDFALEQGDRLLRGPPGSLDGQAVLHPSVVALPSGGYRMFYDGEMAEPEDPSLWVWSILSARSPDGLQWTKEPGVRIATDGATCFDMAWSAHAEIDDSGRTVLYFSAEASPASASGVYRAVSDDGIDFRVEAPPMIALGLVGGHEPDERGRSVPQDPFVLHLPDGERLFYWTQEAGLESAFRPSQPVPPKSL